MTEVPTPCWGQETGKGFGKLLTFINEAHILLVGWREDLTAVGGRPRAAVPLAVVDNSGDRGTRDPST